MDAAFAWLSAIAEWLGMWIPRIQIINATHAGVKFVRGWKVVKLEPGFHIYWPLTTNVDTFPVVRQSIDLRTQTIVTKDGRTIVVGGLIVFEVDDVEKLLAQTFQPDSTIREIALAAIHAACCPLTWDD